MEFTCYDQQWKRDLLSQHYHFSLYCKHEGIDMLYLQHCLDERLRSHSSLVPLKRLLLALERSYAAHRLRKLEFKAQFYRRKLYGTV